MSAKWEEYVEHSASPDENDHLFFLDTGSRACRPPSFDTTIIGSSNPWGDGGATRGELLSRVSASQAGWSASTMGVDSNTDSKRKSPKHHHRRIQRWEEEEETLIRLLGSISPNPRSLINNNK